MKISLERFMVAKAKACMSNRDIQENAKVSSASLARIGKGAETRPQTVGRIARALGIPVEELIESEVLEAYGK